MNEGFTKESLTGCLHDFGNTICSRAEKIADLAISGKTRSLSISIDIDVGNVPNMSICFDQFTDEIRIPWESCERFRLKADDGEVTE